MPLKYKCNTWNDLVNCQLMLFKNGCSWYNYYDKCKLLDKNEVHYYDGTYDITYLIVHNKKIYRTSTDFGNEDAIIFNTREQKLKRILNETE